jgi:hypothetical protein
MRDVFAVVQAIACAQTSQEFQLRSSERGHLVDYLAGTSKRRAGASVSAVASVPQKQANR